MKELLLSLLGLGLCVTAIAKNGTTIDNASKLPFNRIVLFGDSLSDNGNLNHALILANKIDSKIPVLPTPGTGYFEGRFSNGPTWIEDVATQLNLTGTKPLQDNAYGGAQISYEDLQGNPTFFPPNFLVQLAIDQPFEKYLHQNDSSLYVFWIGGNDYIHGFPKDPVSYVQQVLATYQNNLDEAIADNHIKYLLMVNMPDIVKTPYALHSLSAVQQQQLAEMIDAHNQGLYQIYLKEKSAHPEIKIAYFDVFSLMQGEIANPEQDGLTDVSDACLGNNASRLTALNLSAHDKAQLQAFSQMRWWNPKTKRFENGGSLETDPALFTAFKAGVLKETGALTTCATPDTYMFWDDVHPTAYEHKIIAQHAAALINDVFGGENK